jgi:hypothetical protein
MQAFRHLHRGRRCFILGNGPSLRQTDLSRLRGEITFGANRIYLMFETLGFPTTYYAAVNTLVIEQCAEEIRRLNMPKFVTWRGRKWLRGDPQALFVDTDYTGRAEFAGDPTGRVFEGSTVTFLALQLAYYMGCDPVILIGVDHSFTTQGRPKVTTRITSPRATSARASGGSFPTWKPQRRPTGWRVKPLPPTVGRCSTPPSEAS